MLSASDVITIDGLFNDWDNVATFASDIAGDGSSLDFAELRITNDDQFLFLLLEFHGSETLLQDNNDIHLYIDTDNNPATGLGVNGLGADLEWCFGCRNGIYHKTSGDSVILQNAITLRNAPVVTATKFEVAISRFSEMFTAGNGSPPNTIRLFLQESEAGGDLLPDIPMQHYYIIDSTSVAPPEPLPIVRADTASVRLMTYNVLWGGLTDTARQQHFQRIIPALQPDIMAFQEQNDTTQLAALIAEWLPGVTWHMSNQYHNEMIVFSHFPILAEAALTTYGRVNGVLLDTESRLGSHLLVLNAHLSCCAYDSARQAQSDQFIAGLRDIHEGQGPINPPPGTPFVLVGDLNLVGDRRQLVTLTTGDIVDEASYGRDFAPDLDYTHLADLFSRHTHIRMGYTWRSDGSWFSPGKLDYIIYTDSRLKVDNHYVLNTLAIPSDELAALDLDSLDTHSASDHLPRVVDFSLITLGIDQPRQSSAPAGHALVSAYPNPFNPGTIIVVGNLPANPAQVLIYDIKGRLVRTLTGLQPVGGLAEVYWDGTDSRGRSLAAGVYLIKVASGYISGFGKVVLL